MILQGKLNPGVSLNCNAIGAEPGLIGGFSDPTLGFIMFPQHIETW